MVSKSNLRRNAALLFYDKEHEFPIFALLRAANRGIFTDGSTLSLLMLGILADDANDALALNNLALLAHRLNTGSNLHGFLLSCSFGT